MKTEWHKSNTSGGQGLIISETGANIAVSYDEKDAALISSAPDLLAVVAELIELRGQINYDSIIWREAQAAVNKAEGR